MATTALLPVQTAFYTRITGDTTIMAKLASSTSVYDFAPPNPTFPYLVIGDAGEIPDNVFAKDGDEITHTIHIWSRYKGFTEALGILDDLNRLFDHKTFAIAGYTLTNCSYEWGHPMKDPDGYTVHLPARYRVLVQK